MSVSIQLLDCGTLTAGLSMFEDGAESVPTTVPVPSWLIRHPEGLVLFDCGMHTDLTRPGPLLETVSLFFDVELDEQRTVAGQLRSNDVDPADVAVVVLSHLHFDHVGGLAQLPDARVVVQRDEWAAGFDDELGAANTFRRDEYDLGHDVVLADGSHDVFGDGRIQCVPTPGHTPGHQSLQIRLDDHDVVLCGDCAYFERTLDGGRLPPIGHDREQQRTSIERLVDLRDRGATLVPGHDARVFASLPERLG